MSQMILGIFMVRIVDIFFRFALIPLEVDMNLRNFLEVIPTAYLEGLTSCSIYLNDKSFFQDGD